MKRSSVFIRPGQNGRSTFIVVHKRIVMCLLRTAAVDDVNPCICTTREGGELRRRDHQRSGGENIAKVPAGRRRTQGDFGVRQGSPPSRPAGFRLRPRYTDIDKKRRMDRPPICRLFRA